MKTKAARARVFLGCWNLFPWSHLQTKDFASFSSYQLLFLERSSKAYKEWQNCSTHDLAGWTACGSGWLKHLPTGDLGRVAVSNDPRDGRFPGDPHGRVGWGWGGVGDDNVLCTCTHGRCYATSWDGVGDDNVPCTCTHGRCYATSSFLYLHTWSLLRNIMGWGGVGWGGGW